MPMLIQLLISQRERKAWIENERKFGIQKIPFEFPKGKSSSKSKQKLQNVTICNWWIGYKLESLSPLVLFSSPSHTFLSTPFYLFFFSLSFSLYNIQYASPFVSLFLPLSLALSVLYSVCLSLSLCPSLMSISFWFSMPPSLFFLYLSFSCAHRSAQL